MVCYNLSGWMSITLLAVVPGYYLVCYNSALDISVYISAVVPGYYLVCYNWYIKGGD